MFSTRLRELRLEKMYSQKALAAILGVSKQNISDWENKKSETNFEMLIKIAKALDVSSDYLLGLTDDL